MHGLLDVTARTLDQANTCLKVSRKTELTKDEAAGVVRGGILLAIGAFEHFNSRNAASLLIHQTFREPVKDADPSADQRNDHWKGVYNVKKWKFDELGRLTPESVVDSLSRKTLNRTSQIDEYTSIFFDDYEEIWNDAVSLCGERDVKPFQTTLDLFVDRRNTIAHEGDWNGIIYGFSPISPTDLERCLGIVSSLSRSIFERSQAFFNQ